MAPLILPLDPQHLDQVAALELACFSDPWSKALLADSLAQAHNHFWVALDGPLVLGYAGLTAVAGEGYVSNVAVDPAHRRQGVATALVETLCHFGQGSLDFISLEVRASNLAAQALYESQGFSQVGLRKKYYQHPPEDALIFTRHLGTE